MTRPPLDTLSNSLRLLCPQPVTRPVGEELINFYTDTVINKQYLEDKQTYVRTSNWYFKSYHLFK